MVREEPPYRRCCADPGDRSELEAPHYKRGTALTW